MNPHAFTPKPSPDGNAESLQSPDIAVQFGQYLLAGGVLDAKGLERTRHAAAKAGERFDLVLSKLGLVSEGEMARSYAGFLQSPLLGLDQMPAVPVLAEAIPERFLKANRLIPVAARDGVLDVAFTDPFDPEPARALAHLTGLLVNTCIIAPAEFDKAFRELYGKGEAPLLSARPASDSLGELDLQRLRDVASEAPVIKLVNDLIGLAVELRASDIHIEPAPDALKVRYRIDGILQPGRVLSPDLRPAVTSRIKIMARLDIAERRLPQDGRLKATVRGTEIDFRVSTLPTLHGESVVLRILDRSRVELDFGKLGFGDDMVARFRSIFRQPNGILLVTGPTGSGKTTTLYTAIRELNSPGVKIFTVEDPIEYQLDGTNQVQVQPGIGLDFPACLRSILRQDPDIIMIGEIRDLETARIAVQAALTGHLVFSTLHTNSAAATVTRLIDMGIEDFLLTSTVTGILAQRLVRRLCEACAVPDAEGAQVLELTMNRAGAVLPKQSLRVRRPVGCQACGGTGFSGRSTIAELMVMNNDVRRLIGERVPESELEARAGLDGMTTMLRDGLARVADGTTTLAEVLRVTR